MKTLIGKYRYLVVLRIVVLVFIGIHFGFSILKTYYQSQLQRIHSQCGSKRKLSGLKTFARGLSRAIEAVENGINMRWSNGCKYRLKTAQLTKEN